MLLCTVQHLPEDTRVEATSVARGMRLSFSEGDGSRLISLDLNEVAIKAVHDAIGAFIRGELEMGKTVTFTPKAD